MSKVECCRVKKMNETCRMYANQTNLVEAGNDGPKVKTPLTPNPSMSEGLEGTLGLPPNVEWRFELLSLNPQKGG